MELASSIFIGFIMAFDWNAAQHDRVYERLALLRSGWYLI